MIRIFTPMLVLVLLLTACASQPGAPLPQDSPSIMVPTQATLSSTTPAPAQPPAALSEAQLKNATYGGIYDQPVQLVDGNYEGEPFVEGGAARPLVSYAGQFAGDDLDGDGVPDAAVILFENSGGSGTFVYLAALLNQNGEPVNADTVLLGDRVQVKRLAIENGEILLEMLAAGPQDPLCCPSMPVLLTFLLQDGKLVKTAEKAG